MKAALEKAGVKDGELEARMHEIEQRIVRTGSGEETEQKSLGQIVTDSQQFKQLSADRGGKMRLSVKTTITTATGSGAALAPSMRVGAPDMLQQRPLRVRDLLSPGQTDSNSIEYPRQTTRTIAAAMQASEGAAKGESALGFEMVAAPVRTLAHWIPASKQVLDDAPLLASLIDSELRYGLADVEEGQILNGSGTGADLNGVYTQATAFSAPFTMVAPTMLDVVLLAIAQLEAANFQPDGLVMNGTDWARMLALKASDGTYLGNGPFSAEQVQRLWSLPVARSSSMSSDKFLVGAFKRGAQIFDRQDATVEVSTEHSDYFTKNLVAIRAEQRLALAVYRTGAFVKGDFSDAITAATAA
ncbi:MAG: phage major capsid protein [Beijerinckiaceae bacterium]|nr:phage major capsid protein [Beijerinckiaceae bacterium]